MLTTLDYLLRHADEHTYGIAGFDVFNLEDALAVVRAAENRCAPLILMVYEGAFRTIPVEVFAPALGRIARDARVPVALHLDHGTDLDLLRRVIAQGFSSVMYDGSSLPFAENIRNTQAAVRAAAQRGVTVEAELGHVGDGANYAVDGSANLTEPERAAEFVAATGVHCLAVAVGTAHGVYHGTPHIDFERLAAIDRLVSVPLVLHGGSGTGIANIQASIRHGIRKINLYTDLALAAEQAIHDGAARQAAAGKRYEILALRTLASLAMETKAAEYLDAFGASGQAARFKFVVPFGMASC